MLQVLMPLTKVSGDLQRRAIGSWTRVRLQPLGGNSQIQPVAKVLAVELQSGSTARCFTSPDDLHFNHAETQCAARQTCFEDLSDLQTEVVGNEMLVSNSGIYWDPTCTLDLGSRRILLKVAAVGEASSLNLHDTPWNNHGRTWSSPPVWYSAFMVIRDFGCHPRSPMIIPGSVMPIDAPQPCMRGERSSAKTESTEVHRSPEVNRILAGRNVPMKELRS